jgi:hypothetical protein
MVAGSGRQKVVKNITIIIIITIIILIIIA